MSPLVGTLIAIAVVGFFVLNIIGIVLIARRPPGGKPTVQTTTEPVTPPVVETPPHVTVGDQTLLMQKLEEERRVVDALQHQLARVKERQQALRAEIAREEEEERKRDKDRRREEALTGQRYKKLSGKYKERVQSLFYEAQRGNCHGCWAHQTNKNNLELDHIQPQSTGGSNHPSNLQLLCPNCNKIKGNKPMEYLRAALEGQRGAGIHSGMPTRAELPEASVPPNPPPRPHGQQL